MHSTSWLLYTARVRLPGARVWLDYMIYHCQCSSDPLASQHRSLDTIASPDWAARIKLHHNLPRTVPAASLRLLVAISVQLSEEQYTLLMPSLWNQYLEEAPRHVAAPVRPV